jgi:predicted neuraminidase
MHPVLRPAVVAALLLAASTSMAAPPAAVVRSEFLYESAPFPSCHASTIAETPAGLVAAWFGGTHEKHPDVEIWVSRHIDGAWTPPVSAADGIQADGTRHPCWNPVLYQQPSGPLLLFYKVGPSPDAWWGVLRRSDDAGRTWSEPQRLPDDILGPVKNKPVRLADGSLLCPSSVERGIVEDGKRRPQWQLRFERTTDLGRTWSSATVADRNPAVDDGAPILAIQPSVLLHGDGKLQAVGRSRSGKIFETWSSAAGRTWSPPGFLELPNNNSGTDAVTLADGRHLLVYNHTTAGRSPLNLAVSRDGRRWEAALVLEQTDRKEFSYPAIIQTADGLVHITYTWQRKRIAHVVVDPAKLVTKPIVDGTWPAEVAYTPLAVSRPTREPTDYDVVVLGGTPGGIATAVVAARLGRRVALVEYHRHLGAMSSGGLGASDVENRAMIQGFFREFVDRILAHYVERYGRDSEQVQLCRDGYWYEPSVAERIFERLVAEQPTITVLKHHQLVGVEKEGDRVVAATIRDRASGHLKTLAGKIFVDATYEGDLYAAAGAAYRVGRESRDAFHEPHAGHIYVNHRTKETVGGTGRGDDRLPAYTFRLCVTDDPANQVSLTAPPPDYDRTRYLGYLYELTSGRFGPAPNLTTVAFTLRQLPNRKLDVNMKPTPLGFVFVGENAGYADADWPERERITAHLRNLTLGLLWFLQHDESVPPESRALAQTLQLCRDEFADNEHFPFQLYVREARRLVGAYTLSERNISEQPGLESLRTHADAIAVGEFPIDSFPCQKRQPGDDVVLEGYLGMLASITRPYQIPYRIMIPEKLDGVLVPVAASTTHVAFSSIRLEPTWMALGQAAGVAAHLAIEHHVEPRQVPIAELQTILRTQHAVLDLPTN